MLNLKYHLTEEEYFDYNYYTSWAAPEKKNYRLWYYLRVFILYSAVAGLYIFSRRSEEVFIDLIIFGVIALIYFLMVPFLIKRSILRRVRNILAKPENHHVLEEAEVMLSDAGIVDKDTATESRYAWEAIVKKAETPACFYLYTSTYHAIVIPRRVIATAQDKQELERLFNAYLPLSSEFPTK